MVATTGTLRLSVCPKCGGTLRVIYKERSYTEEVYAVDPLTAEGHEILEEHWEDTLESEYVLYCKAGCNLDAYQVGEHFDFNTIDMVFVWYEDEETDDRS